MTHPAASRFAIVIPARYEPARFPGTPLTGLFVEVLQAQAIDAAVKDMQPAPWEEA